MSDIKIRVFGHLTKDPVSSQSANGMNVCNFTVGSTSSRKNASGGFESEFFSVAVWGKFGDFLSSRLKKGSFVCVEGDFSTNKYTDRNGTERTSLSITATDCKILPNQQRSGNAAQEAPQKAAVTAPAAPADPDELPF